MNEVLIGGSNYGTVSNGSVSINEARKNQKFRSGDTVELLSGSPIMTVTAVDSSVHTVWFRGKELCSGEFPACALIHMSPAWHNMGSDEE